MIDIHVTRFTAGGTERTHERGAFREDTEGLEWHVVNLYPDVRCQEVVGFGGAFTEAACATLHRMSPAGRASVLRDYFGEGGAGYSFCRASVDSCDFSIGTYEADGDPEDEALVRFSLARDERWVIPTILEAQALRGAPIRILLSPWSPPAYMKTNGIRQHGGRLKPECREHWARYLARYVREYRARGIHVAALSVQNEPKASQTWDSCLYTAQEEAEFVSGFLAPALAAEGLGDVEIVIWDHNKERVYERARDAFAHADCRARTAAVGFHWYSGDHFEALRILRERYPEKRLYFTEGCVEYSRPGAGDPVRNAFQYAHDLLGNLEHGANAFIDWNLVLDERGGPNYVGNFCDAPVLCTPDRDAYERHPSFDAIAHFSRFILPGAVRIGSSRYTDRIETSAFRNPDGRLVLVVLNRTAESLPYIVRVGKRIHERTAGPHSLSTLVFDDPNEEA